LKEKKSDMGAGQTEVIFSGFALSNSYAYRKFNTLGQGATAILVDAYGSVSGVTYTIRAYPNLDAAPAYVKTIKSDTTMASGDIHYLVTGNPYNQLDVGVKSAQSNRSGRVSVFVTGKRRT